MPKSMILHILILIMEQLQFHCDNIDDQLLVKFNSLRNKRSICKSRNAYHNVIASFDQPTLLTILIVIQDVFNIDLTLIQTRLSL